MGLIQRIALALVIIGAINWGLIGFFRFDLVASIFGGQQSIWSRIVYSLVGLSGLYSLTILLNRIEATDRERVDVPHKVNYGTEFGSEFDIEEKKDNKKKK